MDAMRLEHGERVIISLIAILQVYTTVLYMSMKITPLGCPAPDATETVPSVPIVADVAAEER